MLATRAEHNKAKWKVPFLIKCDAESGSWYWLAVYDECMLYRIGKANIIWLAFSATRSPRDLPRNTKPTLCDVESNAPTMKNSNIHPEIPQTFHAWAPLACWVCIGSWLTLLYPLTIVLSNAHIPPIPLRKPGGSKEHHHGYRSEIQN